jgi:hypothetical protein
MRAGYFTSTAEMVLGPSTPGRPASVAGRIGQRVKIDDCPCCASKAGEGRPRRATPPRPLELQWDWHSRCSQKVLVSRALGEAGQREQVGCSSWATSPGVERCGAARRPTGVALAGCLRDSARADEFMGVPRDRGLGLRRTQTAVGCWARCMGVFVGVPLSTTEKVW